MSELKQLRLQLKERDARISQLEASEKKLQGDLEELEAAVLKDAEVIHQAKQIVDAYTAGLNLIHAAYQNHATEEQNAHE